MKFCDLAHPLLPWRDVGLFAVQVPGRRSIAGRWRGAKAAGIDPIVAAIGP